MTVFAERENLHCIRIHAERLCLALARALHCGARLSDEATARLVHKTAMQAATMHVLERRRDA